MNFEKYSSMLQKYLNELRYNVRIPHPDIQSYYIKGYIYSQAFFIISEKTII